MNLTEIKAMIVKGVGIVPAHYLLRLVAVAAGISLDPAGNSNFTTSSGNMTVQAAGNVVATGATETEVTW